MTRSSQLGTPSTTRMRAPVSSLTCFTIVPALPITPPTCSTMTLTSRAGLSNCPKHAPWPEEHMRAPVSPHACFATVPAFPIHATTLQRHHPRYSTASLLTSQLVYITVGILATVHLQGMSQQSQSCQNEDA